jgi:hypothetical protein
MPEREHDRIVDAVGRLTNLTQSGELKWSLQSYPYGDTGVIGPIYRAEHKGRMLRLRKCEVEVEESRSWRKRAQEVRYVLDFVDENNNSIWAFPASDAVEHLYDAVGYQTAGVSEYLDDLLKREDEE